MLMKYKDLGKVLSKKEMKNVNGGVNQVPGCPTGQTCYYSTRGGMAQSICGSYANPNGGGSACMCIGSTFYCQLNNA